MSNKRTKIGTRVFGNIIEVTDPCYNKDVRCKMSVKIKPGEYECYVTTDKHDLVRFIEIELSNEKKEREWAFIGEIGVDAGLAGFFENKPDFNSEEWGNFCDNLSREEREGKIGHFIDSGFFSCSGSGDGVYDVYDKRNAEGLIVALRIDFTQWDF